MALTAAVAMTAAVAVTAPVALTPPLHLSLDLFETPALAMLSRKLQGLGVWALGEQCVGSLSTSLSLSTYLCLRSLWALGEQQTERWS